MAGEGHGAETRLAKRGRERAREEEWRWRWRRTARRHETVRERVIRKPAMGESYMYQRLPFNRAEEEEDAEEDDEERGRRMRGSGASSGQMVKTGV